MDLCSRVYKCKPCLGFILVIVMGLLFGCSPSQTSQGSHQGVRSVGLIAAKQALDREQAVFMDVRESYEFFDSHIPGAISIPLDALETRYEDLQPSDWVLVYCDCPDEKDARTAAQFLVQNGFEEVNYIIGGFQGWISAGYPVEP